MITVFLTANSFDGHYLEGDHIWLTMDEKYIKKLIGILYLAKSLRVLDGDFSEISFRDSVSFGTLEGKKDLRPRLLKIKDTQKLIGTLNFAVPRDVPKFMQKLETVRTDYEEVHASCDGNVYYTAFDHYTGHLIQSSSLSLDELEDLLIMAKEKEKHAVK